MKKTILNEKVSGANGERERITSFRGLRVWQNAMDSGMMVFELTKTFPSDERFSLVDQLRRCSRSVAANISEAWRKRRYPAAFVAKLNDAEAEAAETQTQLEFALRCRYISQPDFESLDSKYESILGMLVVMVTNPDAWTLPPKR